MQSQIVKLTNSTRRYLRPKLAKYPHLHNLSISIHRKYCSTTGFLHLLPDFYLIGFAKCGTSSLYEYLIQHPSISPAATKEIHFFDRHFGRGINWYKNNFPFKFQRNLLTLNKKNFLTGEATPRYIEHPFAPNRIKSFTPNAKFIILVRNPVDRAYSHWNMNVRGKVEPLSFEDALNEEENRTKNEYKKMIDDPDYYSRSYYRYSYLERGMYVKKIKNWMKIFPKENFIVIKSEDFFSNPSSSYNQILDFFELHSWELSEYKQHRVGKYKKSKMDYETRKRLLEFYQPYNDELSDLLKADFSWNK